MDDVTEPDLDYGICDPTYSSQQMDDENAMNLELDTLSAYFEANSDVTPGKLLLFIEINC